MAIHFTKDGIYADTEAERLEFYDRLCTGDPIIMGHLELYDMELEVVGDTTQQ